jgi:hypothetical protein
MTSNLYLRILDRTIEIQSSSHRVRALLLKSYGHLEVPGTSADLAYSIDEVPGGGLAVQRGEVLIPVPGAVDLLPYFDDDLVVQLQLLRPDLYFEHAAVVAREGRAYLLPAPRGNGKSTLAWALLHHGLRYLSDELGPVDPQTWSVAPFSRAICLKQDPQPPYEAPIGLADGGPLLHLPVGCLPLPPIEAPLALAGVLFPRFDPDARGPEIRPVSTATAAARLYSNALNPLAHPGAGLDVALELASRIPSWELTTSGLAETCELVVQTIATGS